MLRTTPALTDITSKTADVFQHAGLDFGILYEAEQNAGNDVRRVGEEGLFEMLVEKNVEALKKCEYKTIVTTDPHSYNTLKHEYPFSPAQKRWPGTHPVLHYTRTTRPVDRFRPSEVLQATGLHRHLP